MSIQNILQRLEELVGIHEELAAVSKQKTEIVKQGSIEKLQSLLVKERKHIRVLEEAEKNRQAAIEAWFSMNKLPLKNATITDMLEIVSDESEKQKLAAVTTALTEVITKLKRQEQLNKSLLNQSMQFVQLSIDMMNPTIKNMNYGNENKGSESMKRSLFDSQV